MMAMAMSIVMGMGMWWRMGMVDTRDAND
jgi:hypothetical protein